MLKTIHSAVLPDTLGAITLIEDPRKFVKCAADSGVNFDYEALKPDKDHVGIHLVGLGDVEAFGFNRNGDGFPKLACQKYHDTFVKYGSVYRHHKHTDKSLSVGNIKASAYNDNMHRIELYIHADKKKAEAELQKLASDGEIPFSMSCRVPGDRCNRCNTFRTSSKDPNQCDHIKYALGRLDDEGRINGVYNDDPRFFDMSFVIKPADRTAWSLKTACEDITKISSAALAEMEDFYVPHEVMLDSRSALSKYALGTKIAEYERRFMKMAAVGPANHEERQLWELRKSAALQAIPDTIITALRNHEPQDVFYALASHNIIMDPVSYVKYAMGVDMGSLAPHIADIKTACAGACSNFLDSRELYDICNESTYDVDDYLKYGDYGRNTAVKTAELARASGSLDPDIARERTILNTIDRIPVVIGFTKKSEENNNSGLATCVARKYIAYKLAAADAMQALNKQINEQHFALMAAGNIVNAN